MPTDGKQTGIMETEGRRNPASFGKGMNGNEMDFEQDSSRGTRLTRGGGGAMIRYERKARIMKARLILLIALAAGAAAAQPPETYQTFESTTSASTFERRIVYDARSRDEFHGRHFALDGIAVEAVKSPRHLEMFNPFDPANAGPMVDNTVWADEKKSKVTGWSIFSLRF